MNEVTQERKAFLSTLQADPKERRLAFIVALISLLIFIILVPFASVKLIPVPAFIPIYESALVINDLITAILLFGQFNLMRSYKLQLLACGYLFTASIAVFHALSFPGLFSPTGLLGAGTQTTVWLYMFWHGFFPLFIISYIFVKDKEIKK